MYKKYKTSVFDQKKSKSILNGLNMMSVSVTVSVTVRAGVCRPCVETKLTATEKSATDHSQL